MLSEANGAGVTPMDSTATGLLEVWIWVVTNGMSADQEFGKDRLKTDDKEGKGKRSVDGLSHRNAHAMAFLVEHLSS